MRAAIFYASGIHSMILFQNQLLLLCWAEKVPGLGIKLIPGLKPRPELGLKSGPGLKPEPVFMD